MADGSVKIDIVADDSDIKKKLNDVEDSFEDLGKKQQKSNNKTEETASKYKELTATIAKQKTELAALKGEYTQAVVNFGKGSKEAKELESKMSSLNSELAKNKGHLAGAEAAADKLSDALDDNAKSFGAADVAIGSFIANGVSALVSKVGDAIASIAALADETREYREDMAKLETAFTTAGHSTETANAAYSSFYKILGESDRSVEAVNHLAELTKNEEELAQWSTIAAGVTAKFGDSLPIEGLTEAANETAKVGQVTGPLADALNWAGISEDEFNKKLEKCNSEQERATLITNTLNGEYAAAAEEYNKLTANTQAARDATNNMEQAQAALGAAIEPVTTAWTNMKAGALQWFVDTGLPAMQAGWQWIQGNLPAIAVIVGGLTAAWLAFGGAQTILNAVQTAGIAVQTALNAVMNANPIGLIILAITALVAGFMILWNNCEGFRNFWIGLWEGIKAILEPVVEWIKEAFVIAWEGIKSAWDAVSPYFAMVWGNIQAVFSVVATYLSGMFKTAWELIKAVWNTVSPYFAMVWGNIQAVFSVVATYLSGMFKTAWELIKAVWNTVAAYFAAVWATIKGIFAVVAAVLSGNWSEAWEAIKGIVGAWVAYFQSIWSGIKNVFGAVGSWFSSTFKAAWDAIKNIWNNVKTFFAGVWSNIKGAFKVGEMSEIGGDIVKGLWEGINNLTAWIAGKIKSFCSNALQAIKDFFGVASPAKTTIEVGKYLVEGLARGIDGNRKKAIKSMRTLGADVLREMHKTRQKEIDEIKKSIADKEYAFSRLPETMQQYTSDAHKAEVKALEDQIKTLEGQQKNYESFFDAYKTYTDNMLKLEETYAANVKKVKDKLADDIDAANERYASALESRAESIKGELNIFEMVERAEDVESEDLTRALKTQVGMLKKYNEVLDELSSKNVDETFIEEMKGMGIDALPQLKAINSMTDEELAEYVELWKNKNSLAKEAATEELKAMREETDKEIELLRADADKELEGLRQDYRENILAFTKELGLSMQQIGDESIKSLGLQVTLYAQTGSNLMQGLVDGIESEKDSVIAGVVDNVIAAIEAAKEAAGIHSPSTVMRDQIGKNLGRGLSKGWSDEVGNIKKTMSADLSGIVARVKAAVNAESARYAHSAGAPDTGFSEMARAVGLQTAGINSLAGEFRRGTGATRPIIIQLDKRELGRAVVDVGGTEELRIGSKLALGGAV